MLEGQLPGHCYLEECDPEIHVLRREDGFFVATFSARGVTTEFITQAAEEDYRELIRKSVQANTGRPVSRYPL